MEAVIAVFIGCWLSAAGLLAYRQMKKEFYGNVKHEGEEK